MRIIDKNFDFYDYLQDYDNNLVFDRRGSFNLSRDMMTSAIRFYTSYDYSKYQFVSLQCGPRFWLLLYEMSYDSQGYFDNYTVQLLTTWTNYNKPNNLFQFLLLFIYPYGKYYSYKRKEFLLNKIIQDIDVIADSHDKGIYKTKPLNFRKPGFPILKSSGLTDAVDPQLLFTAIEEYFSIEKQNAETTVPRGQTNDMKIEAHGFDLKTSFRGKV